jgi:hypothetical protein
VTGIFSGCFRALPWGQAAFTLISGRRTTGASPAVISILLAAPTARLQKRSAGRPFMSRVVIAKSR